MAGKTTIKQEAWFGGFSDDPRQNTGNGLIAARHFDIFQAPNRLVPYRSFIDDTSDGTTSTAMKAYFIKDFLYGSATGKLYGLGQNASGYPKILQKASAVTGNWSAPASSEGNGAVKYGNFAEYKDYIWFMQGTANVAKWGPLSGTPTITNSAGTVGTVKSTVTAVTVSTAGSGYQINDILTLQTGSGTARCVVTALTGGAGSGVSTVTISDPGYNYTTGAKTTTVVPAGGTGCQITVSTVADTTQSISTVADGIIAKDDNLYMAYNNIIVRVYPSGTVQDNALKLPTNLKITSLENYGNFLAIGCSTKDGNEGVSKVFLWNLVSSDVQAVIDWGEGDLRVLGVIEGILVGISDRYLNNSSGAGRGSVIIQTYTGGSPNVVKELFTTKLTGSTIPLSKSVRNNRLFFGAKLYTSDTDYNEGIWSFGRKNGSYPFAVSLDYEVASLNSFGTAANYFYASTSTDGSIKKISDSATYTQSSTAETQIWDFDDIETEKRLNKIVVTYRALATGEAINVYYKVDGDSSWTLIGTANTVGSLYKTFTDISGAAFKSGREFRFKVESTGGAEITSLKAVVEPFNTL